LNSKTSDIKQVYQTPNDLRHTTTSFSLLKKLGVGLIGKMLHRIQAQRNIGA
jgi:hypothetical protein